MMKKFFAFFVIACFALTASAQENENPFLVKGRSWYGWYCLKDGNAVHYQWVVEGDSLVGDVAYQVIGKYEKCENTGGKFTHAGCFLMREEGKKVYVRLEDTAADWLLYDFGLEEGDVIACDRWDASQKYRVNKVDTVALYGKEYRRLFMGSLNGYSGDDPQPLTSSGSETSFTDIWLEGLGGVSHGGNLLSVKPGFYGEYMVQYGLWYCLQDGELLGSYQDWYKDISKVDELRSEKSSQQVFDLTGKVLRTEGKSQLPKGIYIQNGRKFVVK